MGEFGPGVERGAVFVEREAAGRAVVHAAFFQAGHLGGALGLALLFAGFFGAGGDGRGREIEGEAGGIGFHVADAQGDFLFVGRTLVDGEVQGSDALLVAFQVGKFGPVREAARGLDDERAVHEKQGLGGDDRLVAATAGEVGVGEVELREEFGWVAPVDVGVDGAAGGEFFAAHRDRAAAEFGLEGAGDGEERIVELLEIEAADRGAPKVAIVGILLGVLGVVGGALLVGGAEDDEAVEFFDGPTVFNEAAREVVEEFGVAGWGGHVAEVVGGGDEAGAEVLLPDAVDEDARGHGVFGVGDSEGEREAATALVPFGALLGIG